MSSSLKYFVGNWKMFGIPSSIKILDKINSYFLKDKKNNKKYKILIAPPLTLIQDFSKKYRNKKILISAQNCFYKDKFGSYTGSVSPYMIKNVGVKYIIIGHSENRAQGETNKIIKEKVLLSLKNNFTVLLCIGENINEKNKKLTSKVLNSQLRNVLKKNYNFKKIIIAYEPVWSIGSGKTPTNNELTKTILSIRKFLKNSLKTKEHIKILYGGSVDKKSINYFKSIKASFLAGSILPELSTCTCL